MCQINKEMEMKEVTLMSLNDNFDEIFDEVKDGECFTITDEDGQPLAVLIPYDEYQQIQSAGI